VPVKFSVAPSSCRSCLDDAVSRCAPRAPGRETAKGSRPARFRPRVDLRRLPWNSPLPERGGDPGSGDPPQPVPAPVIHEATGLIL
jgi:hypothetical protein